MKRFFTAHTRGPNFEYLKKKGFTVLFPVVDDYVFLEDRKDLLPLLKKQTELCVYFLRDRNGYVTVSEEEVMAMRACSTDKIEVGALIKVVAGPYENLEGTVLEEKGEAYLCKLSGFNREYEVEVSRLDLVLRDLDLPQVLADWGDGYKEI